MDNRPPIDRINFEEIGARVKDLLQYLPQYLKNPVAGIKRVPAWDWYTLLILQISASAAVSILTGVATRNLLQIFGGIILGPIYGLIFSFLISVILYYVFLFLMDTQLEFRKMYTVVILAGLPASIINILGAVLWPVSFIALAGFSWLLILGISENFLIDRKRVSKLVVPLVIISSLFIFFSVIKTLMSSRVQIQEYTPESLDQIHKELNEGQ